MLGHLSATGEIPKTTGDLPEPARAKPPPLIGVGWTVSGGGGFDRTERLLVGEPT